MTKTKILAAVTVVALTVTTIPLSLLLGNREQPPESIVWPGKVIPKLSSARNIRDKHPQITCLNEHYGPKIVWNLAVIHKDTQFSDVNNFDANSKSCLLIEYYRQNYEGDRWWGEFRLIWSVKDETNSQGLITVTNVRTDDGKLKGNSAAYNLKKNDDNKKSWSATRQKEIQESKKNKSDLERLIPKLNSTLLQASEADNYWGFNQNLEKICKKGECKRIKDEKIHKHYSWEFSGGSGENEVHSWASNIDTWLNKIFGWEKIKSKISNVKGKWEAKQN